MWYNVSKTLSYNCLFNFVIGARGCGKTFACKDWAIKDFIKNENEFIYLRRYDSELKKSKDKFFNDIQFKFEENNLEYKQNKFYINNKIAGYPCALSKAKTFKSIAYPKVNKIIFDEFIIEKGTHHYLSDEVTCFLEFYETVARMRDVKVLFISNAITMANPYFLYFNLELPFNSSVKRKDEFLLEMWKDTEFINAKEKTRFGKIIKDTKYGDYAINNEFLIDNSTFLEKKGESAKYYFTVQFKNNNYGFWIDYSNGLIFVSTDIDKSCKINYALTLNDHSPNTLMINALNKAVLFKTFIDNFKLGNVRFENAKVKSETMDFIKLFVR